MNRMSDMGEGMHWNAGVNSLFPSTEAQNSENITQMKREINEENSGLEMPLILIHYMERPYIKLKSLDFTSDAEEGVASGSQTSLKWTSSGVFFSNETHICFYALT